MIDTPFLAVDLDAFERNVAACFSRLAHVRVRPHQKTAKSPDVALALVAAGAGGICVATLGEAEAMLAAGIDDVLITTELAGPVKARRLADALCRWPEARVRIVVDSPEGAHAIDGALDRPLEALIEVDVGQARCGVAPEAVADLAERLRACKHLRVVGLQGYEGNLQLIADPGERRARCDAAMDRLAIAVDALGGAEVVTTGGTGTAEFCAAHDVVTEVQPGSFVFMDGAYAATGAPYEPALLLHATVISHPAPDRAVVDAGLKALSSDHGPATVAAPAGWAYAPAGDEHGVLTPSPGAEPLRIGDRVRLLPSHGDTTVHLHAALHLHRAGTPAGTWPVSARG